MSCNQDGVKSQSLGSTLGVGDTEMVQMSARRGDKLWEEKPVAPQEISEAAGIMAALKQVEANQESRPFVVRFDSAGDYATFDTPKEAINAAREAGGAAYVPADGAVVQGHFSPVAIFNPDGEAMLVRRDYVGQAKTNQEIGQAIPAWLRHTTEPYDDWAFDEETGTLEIYNGDDTETYQRADLVEAIWGASDD